MTHAHDGTMAPAHTSSVDKTTDNVASFVRLFLGAFLSMADMATDIVAITKFLRHSHYGFAKSLIIMISINMVIQLMIVFFQHRKKGARTLLLEASLTLTCVAPGVQAYRVARGHEQQAKETLDPKNMLMCSKVTELCFEAVPGLVLQFYAFLTLPTSSAFALVSISTSASLVAFNVSVIFFDMDTNANRREFNPLFWGVFPADSISRTLAFFCLFVFSLAHVVSKTLSFALFWATFGGPGVLGYYGCELGFFFTVKVLRRDLFTWVPVLGFPPPPPHQPCPPPSPHSSSLPRTPSSPPPLSPLTLNP
jgi:hypothetical protein